MSKYISPLNFGAFAGNLTSNPTFKKTESGISVSRFTLAISNFYNNKQGETVNKPFFLPVVSFGDVADSIFNTFSKGDPISIVGRFQNESLDNGNSFISFIVTKIKS